MSKHTPGPWPIEYNNSDERSGGCWYSVGPATFHFPYSATDDEEQDVIYYAKLFAAAPETAAERDRLREINAELLEALTDALKDYDAWLEGTDVTPNESLQAWTSKARAAIAKATEGQQ